MVNKQENTRRLAKNTLLLSFRSLFNLFCSLYSSRLILQALGVEDYGIYNAVAGFVSMFVLVTGSLGSAIGRYITVALGKGDEKQLKNVFSMSLTIMLCFAVVILVLTESFGMWFLENKMTITPGRENAAFWVFQFSVISIVTSLFIVPYNASVIAHEKMGLYAYTGIAETLLRLLLALFMVYGTYRMDTLILYAVVCLLSTLSIQIFVAGYCRRYFNECRFKLFFERLLFKDMFVYAGWHFVEKISSTFSGQGVNMVINVFLGPVINSARGLTNTVSTVVHLFVRNFTMALSPQITKSYAAGDLDGMHRLVCRGAKFSYFMMFMMALPLICEADKILSLWLVEVPPSAVILVQLSLVLGIFDCVGSSGFTACMATGKLKKYSIVISSIAFLEFPLSWLAFSLGGPVVSAYYLYIVVKAAVLIARLFLMQEMVSLPVSMFVRSVFVPIIMTTVISIIPMAIIIITMPESVPRLILSVAIGVSSVALASLFIGMTTDERRVVLSKAKEVKTKILGK